METKPDCKSMDFNSSQERIIIPSIRFVQVLTDGLFSSQQITQCKPVLVGQNIAFDIGFLQQLMNYAGLAAEFEKTFSGTRDYYGNFQPHYIDTLAVGRLAFAADPEVTSYKLELVASKLGVELDDAHDAAADVTATLDILGVYTSRLRQTEGAAIATQKKEKTRKYFKI